MGYDSETNSIITSFRGTDNLVNLLSDADFIKFDYPGCENCQVHRGFYESYHSLSADVLSYLQRLKALYPEATVIVTGHSLGGA
jgi:alpha-beta hydrolase superfamily lysophospholipase